MPANKPNFFDPQVQGVNFQTWGPQGWGGSTGYHPYAGTGKDYFVVEPAVEQFLRQSGYGGSLTGSNYTPQQVDRRDAADRGQTLLQAQMGEADKAWTRSPELDQFLADKGWSLQGGRYQQPGESQAINLQRLVDSTGKPLAVNEYNDRTTAMEKATRAGVGALMLYTGAGLAGLAGAPGGAAAGSGAGAGGTSIGLGGSMGGAGWAPASVVNPAIGQTVGQSIAAGLSGTGIGTGLLGAGAGAAGGGSLLGAGGVGGGAISQIAPTAAQSIAVTAPSSVAPVMAGATNPALIDSALGTSGYGASSAGAGGMGMNWLDMAKLGLQAFGAVQGYRDNKDQQTTQSRDPWGPAQPYILEALQQGQKLSQQYQQNPFSEQQQAAYNNVGNVLNLLNQNAPGLLQGFQANATGANSFDRSNPRRSLLGSAPMQGNWSPGLLSFFQPKRGG